MSHFSVRSKLSESESWNQTKHQTNPSTSSKFFEPPPQQQQQQQQQQQDLRYLKPRSKIDQFLMEACNYIVPQWPANELLIKYQYISDFFIAIACFSIPLEVIYFVMRSALFPYKWVLVQSSAFIMLSGITHLISLWTFNIHSWNVLIVMTLAKFLTAIVSLATALMLVRIVPDLLVNCKSRELALKNKIAELDKEICNDLI